MPKKKTDAPEMKVIKRRETLKFHYHPQVVLDNLKKIVEGYHADKEINPSLVYLFDDVLKLAEYSVSKLQPEPIKEYGKGASGDAPQNKSTGK
jgi:hypothetical protein